MIVLFAMLMIGFVMGLVFGWFMGGMKDEDNKEEV